MCGPWYRYQAEDRKHRGGNQPGNFGPESKRASHFLALGGLVCFSDAKRRLSKARQQLIDIGLVHGVGRELWTVQQFDGAGNDRGGGVTCFAGLALHAEFEMICATLDSIAFSVVTTLVMRWPVMSWKLHAS
jgi:hypothetical protein